MYVCMHKCLSKYTASGVHVHMGMRIRMYIHTSMHIRKSTY